MQTLLLSLMLATQGDLLVKVYSTSCVTKPQFVCTTVLDLKDTKGRTFTAVRKCDVTTKVCKIVGINK
jgi:hypothetical protein